MSLRREKVTAVSGIPIVVFLLAGLLLISSAAFGSSFKAARNYVVGAHPVAIAAGDFNGDGKVDLAVANGGKTVSVLLGNGDGTFGKAAEYAIGVIPSQIAVADINENGFADIAVSGKDSTTVSVLMGRGDGSFESHVEMEASQLSAELVARLQPATTYHSGTQSASVVFADFNGDGHQDEAVALSGRNQVSVLLSVPEAGGGGGGTNILENSSFETGSLPPWMQGHDYCGSDCEAWSVVSYHPRVGSWDAGNEGNIELVQNFAGTPTSSITNVTFWSWHPSDAVPEAVDFVYTDGTDDEYVVFPTDTNWESFNVSDDLATGLSLKGIGIWGYSGGIGPAITYLDGVEILVSN
jgi:hypothetical protein